MRARTLRYHVAAILLFVIAGSSVIRAQETVELIVRVRSVTQIPQLRQIMVDAGAVRPSLRPAVQHPEQGGRSTLASHDIDRYVVVSVNVDVAERVRHVLSQNASVEDVFPNHRYRISTSPNDSLYTRQYMLARIDIERAWDVTSGDTSIIIAFLDTGIDYDHPDLRGALAVNTGEDANGNGSFDPWPTVERINGVSGDLNGIDNDNNGYVDDVIGYDFVDQLVPNLGDWSARDSDPMDDNGHGTTVAGVVAARVNNRIGIAGIAPGVRIITLRCFDASGYGDDDDVAAATVYAVDRGARIINMSFGDYYDSPLLHDAVRYAHSRGVVVVASAGNEGISDLHYPSSFPEVISVGSTTRDDLLSSFSSFGSQISVTAPGSDIQTLALGGGYTRSSGTSLSAPCVSGVAALLLSANPNWNADEVRTALELSSDDLGRPGWDVYFGAGRVNAGAALAYPGPPSISISKPQFSEGFAPLGFTAIVGSVSSPLLKTWRLDLGRGEAPSEWTAIAGPDYRGRVMDTLGVVSLADLAPSVYMLRIVAEESNGRSTERRTRVVIGSPPPHIVAVDTGDVWRFDRRSFFVAVAADQSCDMEVLIRRADGNGDWRAVSLEPERSGRRRMHRVFITEAEMEPDVPYDYYVVLRNAAQDSVTIGSRESPLRHVRSGDAFAPTGLLEKPYAIPYGYVMNDVRNVVSRMPTLAVNRFGADGDFGDLMIYSMEEGDLRPVDSLQMQWAPRSFGDLDGDGLFEILGQAFGAGIVLGQTSRSSSPLQYERFIDSTTGEFYAARLVDLDADGRDEIVARTSNLIEAQMYVARLRNNQLERAATLPNPTRPARGDAQNFLGPPVVEVVDFDGDGRPDILFGDEDADFVIYRNLGALQFEPWWSVEHEGSAGSEFIASADVDGDGRPEALVVYHSRLAVFPGEEYPPALWTAELHSFQSDGTSQLMWADRFAYVRPTNTLRSGITMGDVDTRSGSELVLNLFPNCYVLRWDSLQRRVVPMVWKGGVVGNRPVIADLDGNGLPDIGLGNSQIIQFYEVDTRTRIQEGPRGMRATAIHDSSIIIEWTAAPGAVQYVVYRATPDSSSGSLQFDSIAVTNATVLRDDGLNTSLGRLASRTLYYYIVIAQSGPGHEYSSPLGSPVRAFTHAPVRIDTAWFVSPTVLRVTFTDTISQSLYRPDAVTARNREGEAQRVSSIATAGDRSLVVHFEQNVSDTVNLSLTVLFRDYWGSPGDTSHSVIATPIFPEEPGRRFIATAARPLGAHNIEIEFNRTIDPTTVSIDSITIAPDRRIVSIDAVDTSTNRLIVTLDPTTPIGPYGRLYVVTIQGVADLAGRSINDGAGSVVGFTIESPNLEQVVVFPQPFSLERDGEMTFGGLTRNAIVHVLTQTGRAIATVEGTEGSGGLRWNGRDATGALVDPGIYMFIVVSTGENGAAVESVSGKLAIVP